MNDKLKRTIKSSIMCYVVTISCEYKLRQNTSSLMLLRPAYSGINEPWYGQLGEVYGYFKNCTNTDPEMDEVEVWLAFLGKRLGVNMAETCLVLDEHHEKIGSFSTDVAARGGIYLSADQIKNQWLCEQIPVPSWAVRAHEIHCQADKIEPFPDQILSIVEDPEKLTEILQFAYGVLTRGNQYDVRAAFTDMVLFDCMTWQKDRNMNGFGIVEKDDGSCRMAGLYDNASLSIPGIKEYYNGFCNVLCRWETLAECAAGLFPEQAADFSNRLERFLTQEIDDYLQLQQKVLSANYHSMLVERMAGWDSLLHVIRPVAQVHTK